MIQRLLALITIALTLVNADSFDWRSTKNGNMVSSVRNINDLPDRSCGNAGWAFAVTAMISDRLSSLLPKEPKVLLSTQHLVNCVEDFGCSKKGNIEAALRYIKDVHGIPDRTCMGWRGQKEQCSHNTTCINCLQEKCEPRVKYFRYGIKSFGKVKGTKSIKSEIKKNGPVACELKDNTFVSLVGYTDTAFIAKLDRGIFSGERGYSNIDFKSGQVTECWWAKVEKPYRYHDEKLEAEIALEPKVERSAPRACGTVWSKAAREQLKQQHEMEALEDIVSATSRRRLSKEDLPTDFKWEYLTPTQSHHNGPGYCGACWSMASSSSFSDRLKLANGGKHAEDIFVSPQANVDCAYEPHDGCGGGGAEDAFKFMKRGTVHETCLAWLSRPNGVCHRHGAYCQDCPEGNCEPVDDFPMYHVAKFGSMAGEVDIMNELHARGPVTCGIATPPALSEDFVGNDILCDHDTKPSDWDITHLVTVVGWGEDNGKPYWIIRNSWGTHWGENGFARICRGENAPDGNMLLESACTWAVPRLD